MHTFYSDSYHCLFFELFLQGTYNCAEQSRIVNPDKRSPVGLIWYNYRRIESIWLEFIFKCAYCIYREEVVIPNLLCKDEVV